MKWDIKIGKIVELKNFADPKTMYGEVIGITKDNLVIKQRIGGNTTDVKIHHLKMKNITSLEVL